MAVCLTNCERRDKPHPKFSGQGSTKSDGAILEYQGCLESKTLETFRLSDRRITQQLAGPKPVSQVEASSATRIVPRDVAATRMEYGAGPRPLDSTRESTVPHDF